MKIDNFDKDKWTVEEKIEKWRNRGGVTNSISWEGIKRFAGISDRFTLLTSYFPILQ